MKHSEVAETIGVSQQYSYRFLNGVEPVTVQLAKKLEACTNISAATWLDSQIKYDLFTFPLLKKRKRLIE